MELHQPSFSYSSYGNQNQDIPMQDYYHDEQNPSMDPGYFGGSINIDPRTKTIDPRNVSKYRDGLVREASQYDYIERLPSRTKSQKHSRSLHVSSGHQTLRLKQGIDYSVEALADDIMNNPDYSDEEDEADGVKELATNLSNKKIIKEKLRKNRENRERRPGWFKRVKYNISIKQKKFKLQLAELRYSLELWKGHLKVIEGKFGTGVTSYFLFLKWLLLLNIPVILIAFSFLAIPQIVQRLRGSPPVGYTNCTSFTGKELIYGDGFFDCTELYYGSYINNVITVIPLLFYNMQFAYLLVGASYYLLTLIIVAAGLAVSYKQNFITAGDADSFFYSRKVLTSWDFNVSTEQASKLRQSSTFTEIQEHLVSYKNRRNQKTLTTFFSLLIRRVVFNLLILGVLAGSGYLIWYVTNEANLINHSEEFVKEMAIPIIITALNYILPFVFSILGSLENYSDPRIELYLTMFRTILLNFATLGPLVYYYFTVANCNAQSATAVPTSDSITSDNTCLPCWENFLGQQFYRLIIVDFIFIIIVTLVSEFYRRMMSQFFCKSLGHPEFNIGRNTLSLIFSQTLVWVGTFYSPLLSIIMIIKLIVVFYFKRVSVTLCCVPPSKAWKAGRTHTIILSLVLLAFVMSLIALLYGIITITPSQSCGPYQGFNRTFDIFTLELDKLRGSSAGVREFLELITSEAMLAGVFIILVIASHYTRVVSDGHKKVVKLLRDQISLEGQDKVFLLRLLQEAVSKAPGAARTPNKPPPPTGENTKGKLAKTPPTRTATPMSNYKQSTATRQNPNPSTPTSGVKKRPNATPTIDTSAAQTMQFDSEMPQTPSVVGNPGYRDGSPTTKPTLPYPGTGQQYNLDKDNIGRF